MRILLTSFILNFIVSSNIYSQNTTKAVYEIKPQFELLTFGEITPQGWIKDQIINDLDSGFAGNLAEIAPTTCASQIFGNKRNDINKTQSPGGLFEVGSESPWWNGETEGNWLSGNIMMLLLTNNPKYLEIARNRVNYILNMQDSDGYIGVYNTALRWQNANKENGELWTQACILRGLIAYYEATKNNDILVAIEKAVQLTISKYNTNNNAFGKGEGGVYHGLMFADVLERLYHLTGNTAYSNFGLYMYYNFSQSEKNFDMGIKNLLNPLSSITQHGVHVYETLRVPIWVSYLSANPVLQTAKNMALQKIEKLITPSGGPIGDEGVEARSALPTIAYEGCSVKEFMHSAISIAQKTGSAYFAEQAENTFYNAAQGQRLWNGNGLMYLCKDNRLEITGKGRDKFSPSHEDYANCCAPMFSAITPTFARSMFMANSTGIAAMLYGPCKVNTTINNIPVTITEQTMYPFSDTINFNIQTVKPNLFTISLRVPSWAVNTNVTCKNANITKTNNWILITKKWTQSEQIELVFNSNVQLVPANNGEFYIRKGAIVYALPIKTKLKVVKNIAPNYYNYASFANDSLTTNYKLPNILLNSLFNNLEIINNKNYNKMFPYYNAAIKLKTTMVNINTNKIEQVELVPMGCFDALLRQTTFSCKFDSIK